ncbi:pilus assembly protein [Marinobacter gelidimuriae]|uniref:pilus assembly protein n=1 Tax=Marinobacter gelidimuriae TaxID=2739064 RepID=UPI0015A6BAF6|nr:PilC/PilY family type IV pilus protein [Marinobacter gelidimuriae]
MAQTPLFLTQGVQPQVMLSLSNDHQLFFEAYPDYLDLDGDGQPDRTYGHDNDYFGYFDSYKCYDYITDLGRFKPKAVTSDKYCDEVDSVSGDWSGNFLNYLAMSRMDVVRKILFGGFRRVDSADQTVLERAYVPTDAHSWVKYYDGDNLSSLTPFTNGDSITAGSDSVVTPATGDIDFDINASEFMSSVQRGDQVRIYSGSSVVKLLASGQAYMLGAVKSVDLGNAKITVDVTRANGSDELSNWTVENLSRSGISFCNTTNDASLNDGEVVPASKPPRLSVARGNYGLWSANERYQCRWSDEVSDNDGINANNIGVTGFAANDRNPIQSDVGLGEDDYNVRVEVCVTGLIGTERCKEYPAAGSSLKPVGLLQQYGDDSQILFGLLSGSYLKNKSGGVLRKNVTGFDDEVNVATDGTFKDAPTAGGIVSSINLLRMYGYNSSGVYTGNSENCPFGLKSFSNGQCMSWGNPQSEIFLESIRYFAGAAPTSAFAFTGKDKLDGLQGQAWSDTLSEDLQCAPMNVINFNSRAASYDRDQLQSVSDISGSGGVAGIRQIVESIGASEGINGQEWFVGETLNSNNQLCTSKLVGSLAEVAGLCPEAPRLAGGFDSVGIANYAYENDIRPNLTGDQNVKTFAVALAPAVPRIDIPRPETTERAVTILPACQNTEDDGNCAIVDFKVISQDLAAGTGLFLVNWEEAEQGGAYDQDMYGTIQYTITESTLEITTRVAQQSSSRPLAFGYVLNGTEENGFHAHSGINEYSYTDPTGVESCDKCRVSDPATSVTYTLSAGGARDGLLESPMFYAAKWAGYDKEANFPADQSSWDADGDGFPDNYYFAIDPSKLANDLEKVFSDILRDSASAASVAASSTSLNTGTAIYQASFNSQGWSGDLRAFALQGDNTLAETFTWSAADQLDALTAGQVDDRKILTSSDLSTDGQANGVLLSKTGALFTWTDPGLTDTQKTALAKNSNDINTPVSAVVAEDRLDYLRGDRTQEKTLANPGGIFRERGSRLGDIINSNPQFVYQQNFGYGNLAAQTGFSTTIITESYNDFRASDVYQDRPPVVVVGGNDGMLHGFNASSTDAGKELFAYVPADIIKNLHELTELEYTHRYYVDGTPRIGDVWLGTSEKWATVAVGSTGAGGNSIFALDITNPESVGVEDFMWEFSHTDMGNTIQQPSIVALPNGKFGVVVSSGYKDTPVRGGKVWVLDVETGVPIRTFQLPDSGELGSPLVVDLDSDRVSDRIYVGDTSGKLWRLDIVGDDVTDWGAPSTLISGSSNVQPLFAGPTGQTITAPLASAFNADGEHMVYFGTGSFYRVGQNVVADSPQTESFYGIIDRGEPVIKGNLLKQEILTEAVQNSNRFRIVSDNTIADEAGWYIDLKLTVSLGERVVSRALLRGDRVIFTTLIPSSNPCSAGGTSFLMEVDPNDGSRLGFSVFDVNGDGVFNNDDLITVTIGEVEVSVPASGYAPDIGIMNTPTVLTSIKEPEPCEDEDCPPPPQCEEIKVVSGSGGERITIKEQCPVDIGRQNWQQLR